MAEAGEAGVCNLLPELLAHALILLCPLQTAGAVSAGTLQALTDHFGHFLVIIESNCHSQIPF